MSALGQVERLAARGDADHVEAVVGQVPFEEDAGLRLRLGDDQGGGHGAKLASVRAQEQMSFLADLRRTFLSRLGGAWPVGLVLAAAVACAAGGGAPPRWEPRAPLPEPRTEVAATAVGREIVVVGGFLPDGSSSARADAYSPARNEWRRLPDLPAGVNHATAATWRGKAV